MAERDVARIAHSGTAQDELLQPELVREIAS